jgi:undecaprenyl-diphosphatase
MNHLVAIILGFVQGITEFIPISSSGHLIIAREILGIQESDSLSFDAILQLATALSLLFYFRKDIWSVAKNAINFISGKTVEAKDKTLLLAIGFGTIPVVIFGLLFESMMETVFRNVELVALTLILGSFLFWFADKYYEKYSTKTRELTYGKGILIGLFQCLALIPGMSRSGSTISGGLLLGLNKDDAVRFSFLLSFPILFGAGLKKLFEDRGDLLVGDFGGSLLLGSLTAFITGLFAILFLIKYLKNHNFTVFIWYRVGLALLILFSVS